MANLTSDISNALTDRLSIIEALLPQLEKDVLDLQGTSNAKKTKTNIFDLVTEADLHSEKIITSAIQKHFPKDASRRARNTILAQYAPESPMRLLQYNYPDVPGNLA